MFTDEGGGATDPFIAKQIPADVHSIRDFVDVIRDELDQNFQPTKDRVISEYRRGVGFGLGSASADMKTAVWKYFNCMSAATESLNAYGDAAEILIAAATKVADAFRTVDDLSAARLQDIDGALRNAITEADAVRQTAADEAQRRANEQRLARLERDGVL